ncbi:hypothetical protein HJFPF1_11970 [Paramyrothecium foliicola]|nr:hypothetical protein HJFPF1_11970 [Paramyrothecium foliicola]
MPGTNQLPSGAEGAAAFALIYAFVSLTCSCTLLWLLFVHRERWSYIALLAIATGISTIASISQQIHDIVSYEDIVREQFRRRNAAHDNPELAIANASFGVDLVLYYIRANMHISLVNLCLTFLAEYYLYNVQSLLVMFW